MKNIQPYLEWKASYAPYAATVYRRHIERFFKFVEKPIEQVTIFDIGRFVEHAKVTYKISNVAFSLAILKNYFGFWERNGKRGLDPWLIKIPKCVKVPHCAVCEEDVVKMLAVLNPHEFWQLQKIVTIRLLWETGMRLSELCSLDISMLDSRKREVVIITRKRMKPRLVMWSNETHELLLRFLGSRLCLNQQPPLFIAKQKQRRARVTTRTVERWVEEIVKAAGIKKRITPHSFRHGWAHFRRDRGAPISFVSEGLGHSSITSTMTYEQYGSQEFRDVAKKFL